MLIVTKNLTFMGNPMLCTHYAGPIRSRVRPKYRYFVQGFYYFFFNMRLERRAALIRKSHNYRTPIPTFRPKNLRIPKLLFKIHKRKSNGSNSVIKQLKSRNSLGRNCMTEKELAEYPSHYRGRHVLRFDTISGRL